MRAPQWVARPCCELLDGQAVSAREAWCRGEAALTFAPHPATQTSRGSLRGAASGAGEARYHADQLPAAGPKLAASAAQRTETAVSLPFVCAMNKTPCALSVRLPAAGYDHTCACDTRSTA